MAGLYHLHQNRRRDETARKRIAAKRAKRTKPDPKAIVVKTGMDWKVE